MSDAIQMPHTSRPKGRRRTRPIYGQPLAPVLRLVVSNEHPTAPKVKAPPTPQELESFLNQILWHLVMAGRAIKAFSPEE